MIVFVLLIVTIVLVLLYWYNTAQISNFTGKQHVTLVSAYYRFPSKHSTQDYNNWITNFFKNVKCPIVLYTSSDLESYLQEKSAGRSDVKIIVKELHDLYMYKFLNVLKKNYLMDMEKHVHNPNLYIIWNEKTKFVMDAIGNNFFDTNYFCWCDIGYFRDDNYHSKNFPTLTNITQKNKLYILQLHPFTSIEKDMLALIKKKDNHLLNIFQTIVHLSGNCFIGHDSSWNEWNKNYYAIMDKLIENDSFIGKDQDIMALVSGLYPETVSLIEQDNWFFFQKYLDTTGETKGKLNVNLGGGIGNRLFQLASCYGLAKKHDLYLYINNIKYNSHTQNNYKWLMNRFNQNSDEEIDENIISRQLPKEHLGFYDVHVYPGIILEGCFQSELYFKDCKDDIKDLFKIPSHITFNFDFNLIIAIHVRLGDYINSKNHFINLNSYYKKAIQLALEINKNYKFVVICHKKEHDKIFKLYPVLSEYPLIDNPDEEHDLYFMSLCKGGVICANSSFSWWGAYLNQKSNKFVTIPGTWLNDRSDIPTMNNAHVIDID